MNMDFKTLVVDSIKQSNIKKILLIDDVYDPPHFDSDIHGEFKNFLNSPRFHDRIDPSIISAATLESARNAVKSSNYDEDDVIKVYNVTYNHYVAKRENVYDFNDHFYTEKWTSLSKIDPLVNLLNSVGRKIKIEKVGTNDAIDVCNKFTPDVIFMDYILDPVEDNENESIKLLTEILELYKDSYPLIILISSKKLKGYDKKYLRHLKYNNRVMAARFGKIEKEWITEVHGEIEISSDAAEILLDVISSIDFEKAVEKLLTNWRDGVKKAIKKMEIDLWNLDRLDISYLIRHRLQREEESLSDYMEWFLGEAFRTTVDNEITWDKRAVNKINNFNVNDKIIGTHYKPNNVIAKFFHNARFREQKEDRHGRFGLGDLYISDDNKFIRMVLTPDCDLISRGVRNAMNAYRLFTVGGTIVELTDSEASSDEFVIVGRKKMSIKWQFRDISTHRIHSDVSSIFMDDFKVNFYGRKLTFNGCKFSYFSTLRPQYAQYIQNNVFTELSKVGLAVPPAIYTSAKVQTFIKSNDNEMKKLTVLKDSKVTAIITNESGDKNRTVIFSRIFVYKLIEKLNELHNEGKSKRWQNQLSEISSDSENFINSLLRGLPETKTFKGIKVGGEECSKKDWLHFKLIYNS